MCPWKVCTNETHIAWVVFFDYSVQSIFNKNLKRIRRLQNRRKQSHLSRLSAVPIHAGCVRMFVLTRDGCRTETHLLSMPIVTVPSVLVSVHFVALARKIRRRFRMLGDVPRSFCSFRHPLLVSLPPDLSVFGRLFCFLENGYWSVVLR